MTEKQQKLIDLLKEMFQLDQSDLDFGIYRIMNAKSEEISTFLEKDLIGSIKEAFASSAGSSLQQDLATAIEQARALGADPETLPKVQELRAKLAGISGSGALEDEVYSHLANFFSRYYQEGDFISLRRYKKDTYAIPYEGEEVKLHWANSDQFYIKTSEYFRDYAFKVSTADGLIEGEEKTIHFKLIDAETETNNNKASADKERRFVLAENPLEEIDGELIIRFEYKAIGKEKQDALNADAVAKILAASGFESWKTALKTPAPTDKNSKRTVLEKHLTSYTSRNTFDYFIHKDLGGFLSRELDFYIKNEMLYLDDIENATSAKIEESLGKIRTFKHVAKKIIAFLTQLEEFQKSLWLKKKFIIETNYCITLDRIDSKYYAEILANEEQKAEWKKLFSVNVKTLEDLTPYLLIDTKFFSMDFKNKLLSEFDNLDEQIDGVLINSENFGALNLLQERYREQLKSIYIDPPYNTSASEILYKNSYKHSSWMSMVADRIHSSKELLNKEGVLCATIDDVEFTKLYSIMQDEFTSSNIAGVVPIRINPSGRPTEQGFALTHEYAIFARKSEHGGISKMPRTEEQLKRFNEKDKDGIFEYRNLRREGSNSDRKDGERQYYPIYANLSLGTIRVPEMIWHENKREWEILENSFDNEIVIWPITDEGVEKNWRWSEESLKNDYTQFLARIPKNGTPQVYYKYRPNMEGITPMTLWTDAKYSATEHGTKTLKDIFGNSPFSYPKSIFAVEDCISIIGMNKGNETIIDYFAGSGTTGHAVMKLNRKDSGKRKYILVEMGEYFNTVTKPRIQKVIYSDNWKDGKPQDTNGISQMFKYFKLESYEDALNNLAFNRSTEQQRTLDSNPNVREDYTLNYMLDFESAASRLDITAFSKPFDYTLRIATGSAGETKETKIDLVETFNYLIGLKIKSRQIIKGFLVIEGENLKNEKILIIWREGNDNEALNVFFEKMDWSVYDREFDTIYVNGDNNLANLKKDEDHFKVKLIEEEFKNRMFGN